MRTFPIVSVLGARQCGKTTFIKTSLPRWQYLDMEKPSDVIRLSEDPEDALRLLKEHFILDEAQRLPSLFPVLRSFVDQHPEKAGQVVLLGSASLSLIKHISESLAGRVGFLDMTPFQWDEVRGKRKTFTLDALWFRGGFPGSFLKPSEATRTDWFESYTRTFIERDLSVLGIDVSAPQMRRLWTMLAHLNGGIWNASQIAGALGTSYHTVNRYTDILEQTFLIRKLQPYFANIGKRIVKSPKLYFRDTGLLHYFLGLREAKTMDVHPARGASWEAFVIEQMISNFQHLSPGTSGFYWRTSSGVETDLLIERGNKLIPFEIKLHSSPALNEVTGLSSCMKDLNIPRGYVLSRAKTDYSLGHGIKVLSFENLIASPRRLLDL
ncbi:MAG: ATP-binding protein [Nitrospirae bacterium]|nr:ATP-binding protein [Nitrospirota bacterium]MBI3605674.1 ATP-binding protein [Nitrospirota bacterium]